MQILTLLNRFESAFFITLRPILGKVGFRRASACTIPDVVKIDFF